MFKKTNNDKSGQTALILILLTAATLIFYAITLNWGHIAQVKSLISVAADETASLYASDTASYGEMQKQTYLKDKNQLKGETGLLLALILVVVAIVVAVIAIWAAPAAQIFFIAVISSLSVAMAITNLVLQAVVIQPGITSLWNKLQKSQPVQQQFFEQGIVTSLQSAITDTVNITDYFDSNANGVYGNTAADFPQDVVSRFALFYADRLKMLNQVGGQLNPAVVFFYNQLGELMNGETCDQNEVDYASNPALVVLNPVCTALNCGTNPLDPACQVLIPNGFSLNDPCVGSNPAYPAAYTPYCDPCCLPLNSPCDDGSTCTNRLCADGTGCVPARPSSCADQSAVPSECLINNPYNAYGSYPFLYDPSFQNYNAGISFLDKFGRDQQMGPFTALTPQGSAANGIFFPNGIYPFFWMMSQYSPEVDNLPDPVTTPLAATSPGLHWCAAATAAANGAVIPAFTTPTGFLDLAQLNLGGGYSCQGQDCCVNFLADTIECCNTATTTCAPMPAAGCVSPAVATPVSDGSANGTVNGAIDMVGSPTFPYTGALYNPALDPSFAEGAPASTVWLPGDSQMCSAAWPYNGANSTLVDGTCEYTGSVSGPPPFAAASPAGPMTADVLDDTMHTLSDFVSFAKTILVKDVGTLSATFQTWYPQLSTWFPSPCDDGTACGSGGAGECTDNTSCVGRLQPAVTNLTTWNTLITNWLKVSYASANSWCVPPEATLLNGNAATNEDTYINANGGTGLWGDLPHVLACLNYNAGETPTETLANGAMMITETPLANNGAAYNFQQCLAQLTAGTCAATGPCAPAILGRSLAGPAPSTGTGCNVTTAGSYGNWVSNSLALATDEASKFAARSAFLTDIYTKATTMQTIFSQGATLLQNFINGAAAQLVAANPSTQPQATASLPNAVIYGWQDPLPSSSSGGCTDPVTNQRMGCAHIVKVLAYATGRCGGICTSGGSTYADGIDTRTQWIKTATQNFLFIPISRTYTLMDRDGYVFASVKRWDQDHNNSVFFPNGHPLWQYLDQNPAGGSIASSGLPAPCIGLTLASGGDVGYGLEPLTVQGLADPSLPATQQISQIDKTSLSQAFMLNDRGNGAVDPNGGNSGYQGCLTQANQLLANAPESHACAEYIASRNASGNSGTNDYDYSVRFVNCNSVPGYPFPDDLTG